MEEKSFREILIEKISNRSNDPEHKHYKIFEIALVEDSIDEVLKPGFHFFLSNHITSSFPIQKETCEILESRNEVALCFKRKQFLLACIGKKRIEKLNKNRKAIENTLQQIESVLGKVDIVDKLRRQLTDYQTAISQMFDYVEKE